MLCYFWLWEKFVFKVVLAKLQRIPTLRGFWDLKKTTLREIRVSPPKIPHLYVHKPKIAVVGSAVVKTTEVGDSRMF